MDIRELTKPCEIVTDLEKLSERSDEVAIRKESKEIMDINRRLKATIRANQGIRGLCANQIGEAKRICVLNFKGDLLCFVNPMVSEAKGVCLSDETSESLPGRRFLAVRNNDITVRYFEPNGKLNAQHLVGEAATVMQQMNDYMNGVTLEDHALEIDDDYDKATDEEKQAIVNLYLDSLDLKQKDLEKEIKENAEEKEVYDGIDFMEKVQKGEIKLTTQDFQVHIDNPEEQKKKTTKGRKKKK